MSRIDVQQFGRVALAVGGQSQERQVSLDGGRQVLASLEESGVKTTMVDGLPDLLALAANGAIDRVFNLMHGNEGESGLLQGAMRAYGIPVTGSSLAASALSMDKALTKLVWQSKNLPTAPFAVVKQNEDSGASAIDLLPAFVKPCSEGSSLGITKVNDQDELPAAIAAAAQFEARVMIEKAITGGEYTVGLLNDQTLPVIKIETDRPFYDYKAKYEDDDTRYLCPSDLTEAQEGELQKIARRAFDVLGCSGWGRVDFIVDTEKKPWLLEVNTAPGMTSHSLVPKAALQAGISFNELVMRVLQTSLQGGAACA